MSVRRLDILWAARLHTQQDVNLQMSVWWSEKLVWPLRSQITTNVWVGLWTFNEFERREALCEHLRSLRCVWVHDWDSYLSLFKVSHGFIPELLVGCVLPDQLLLLLRQLERLLYLHPFRGRLCRWWRLCRRPTNKTEKGSFSWRMKDNNGN